MQTPFIILDILLRVNVKTERATTTQPSLPDDHVENCNGEESNALRRLRWRFGIPSDWMTNRLQIVVFFFQNEFS